MLVHPASQGGAACLFRWGGRALRWRAPLCWCTGRQPPQTGPCLADCELCASHPSLQAGTSTGARQTGIGIPSR